MYNNNRPYVQRDDNVPGRIYLIEALGYHGIFPGKLLRRCKIGLSRNPQSRLETFQNSQPPCDFKIFRTIHVQDMKTCEDWLHHKFKRSTVKLFKSKEWYDLTPIQFLMVQKALSRLEIQNNSIPRPQINQTIVVGVLIAVSMITLSFQRPQASTSTQPVNHNIKTHLGIKK